MRRKVIWSAQLLVVVLCALALKYHYSTATVDQLRWILAPTTALVELLSGRSFQFESYTGYMSSDHTFVIAAPCAGVNFLIMAFLMLGLRRLWRDRFQASWSFLPVTAAVAYVATLITNTTRIFVALEMQKHSVEVSWLTANQLHRLEGIVVYFGFLLLLFMLAERRRGGNPARLFLVPLFVYYAITVGIPIVNGSYKHGAPFWEHFGFVLVLPLIFVVPLLLIRRLNSTLLTNTRVLKHGRPRSAAPTVAASVENVTARICVPCGCRSLRIPRCDAGRWYGAG
jgi:exosortase K